ncbi:MAG: DUF3800 domain-containing protein, partial [Propionibacteriaceae bacterium]|nr:DUF3800 domain-containing protein [Propionibacteriaceae bacterium]
ARAEFCAALLCLPALAIESLLLLRVPRQRTQSPDALGSAPVRGRQQGGYPSRRQPAIRAPTLSAPRYVRDFVGGSWQAVRVPLLYVDESFNDREFWLSGLVVPMNRAGELEDSLDGIVARAVSDFGVPARVELHGQDLAQGKREWDVLAGKLRARMSLYSDALKAISQVPELRAFQYGLDRERHRKRYANPWPERQVLIGHLAQRVHTSMSSEDHLVVIMDDAPTQESMRSHLRDLKRHGTYSRINSSPLQRIVDTLYFAPSNESRLLQASDLISYIHLRSRFPGTNPRAVQAAHDMWGLVRNRCSPHLWIPK